jgi:phospholipid/cholesterol/gamma-HCH transport system substrate-binding protein
VSPDTPPEDRPRDARSESGGKPLPKVAPSRLLDREFWVGIFVILGVAATLTALFTLTNAALFRGRYVVSTVVPDAAGIRHGDPVQLRGVNIGRVLSFRISPEGQVTIRLEIDNQYKVPEDSKVEIHSAGPLAGMVAAIIPGTSTRSLSRGAVLPGTVAKGLSEQITDLEDSAGKVLLRMQDLLNEKAIRDIHESAAELQSLLRQLDATAGEQRGELAALTGSLRRSANALERTITNPAIGRSLERIDVLTATLDSIASTSSRSAASVDSILARIDRGQGSLGRLTRDDTLYNNAAEAAATMKRTADEFAKLAADVRAHPKKYLKLSLF